MSPPDPSPTVLHPDNQRKSPYNWSTVRPRLPGWYFCRRPNISRDGWVVSAVRIYYPQPGELLRAAWAVDQAYLLTDPFFKEAQFSYEAIPEPVGG